jgi:hypothetical protein
VRPSPITELPSSWYELGRLYALAGEDARRATMEGFAVAFAAGASVLLSAPLFGTAWAGPFAAAIPVAAGLLFGGGRLGWRRASFARRRKAVSRTLHAAGEDAARPTLGGLGAYYDVQLLLLRCEYEYLRGRRGARAARSALLLGETFGFTSEDGFECGPLNVAPDTGEMEALRGRWEARLAVRRASGGGLPALGLREDRAFRVFPREMTVPQELATRGAYLGISCRLLRERYGDGKIAVPEDVRRRAERDLGEYRALVRR